MHTAGDGIAVRDDCRDDAVSVPGDGIAEGAAVHVTGRDDACPGWARAAAPDGRETWVRLRYLSAPDTLPAVAPGATWRDVRALLDDDGRACVDTELTEHGAPAAALDVPVLDTDGLPPSPSWAFALASCIDTPTATAILTTDARAGFRPDQSAAAACVVAYATELHEIVPQLTVMRASDPITDDVLDYLVGMFDNCLTRDAIRAVVFERVAGYTPRPSERACLALRLPAALPGAAPRAAEFADAVAACSLGADWAPPRSAPPSKRPRVRARPWTCSLATAPACRGRAPGTTVSRS